MADETCTAVPRDLIEYALRCKRLDAEISRQAFALAAALDDFAASHPDARYISSLPRLDRDVGDHATRALASDDWVGRVGEAFKQAGTSKTLSVNRALAPGDRIDPATIQLTATISAVDSLVPTGEDALKEEAASQGSMDSAGLLDAYTKDDAGRMEAEIAKLQGHMDDPDYLAGYFRALGPDLIRGIAYYHMTYQHGQQAALKTYDEALGLATQSTVWSTDLDSRLFPPFDGSKLGTSGEVDARRDFASTCEMNEVLLRFGTFSTDALQKAAGEIVLTRVADLVTLPNLTPPGEYANQYRTVLDALSRNPDAALAVLGGHYTHALTNRQDPRANVRILLEAFGQQERQGGDRSIGDHLSAVLLAAGEGSSSADQTHGQLLRDIGSVGDWRDVPDGARPAVARLVSDYIDDFKQGGTGQGDTLTWQQNLFVIAELDSDGKVDGGRLGQINDAIGEADLGGDAHQRQAELHNLTTLGALPIFLSAAYRGELHGQRVSTLLDGLGMIPGVGVVPNVIESVRQFIKGDNVSGGVSALAALADVVGLAFAVRGAQAARAASQGLQGISDVEKGVDLGAVEKAVQEGTPLSEIDKAAADAGEAGRAGEAGGSGGQPLPDVKAPHWRHTLSSVKTTATRKSLNSVIAPWVDVNADIALIKGGEYTRKGSDLIVNGRVYRLKQNGTLFPVSGPGVYQLNRTAYLALGVLNEEGGLTAEAEARFAKYREYQGVTDADIQGALEAWQTGQAGTG